MSRRHLTLIAAPIAALVLLATAWELYVDLGGVDPLVLPAPHAIAAALWTDRATLASNLLVTAEEVVGGILLGAAAALAMTVLIHFSRVARAALYPLLVASQALPIPIVAPVLVFWLGFGILPKLVVIALVSFFPIVVGTLGALARVDPDLVRLMRTFDATRRQVFTIVELPSALPAVFTGAKLAAVFSVTGAVLAEEAGSSRGLGYLLLSTGPNLEIAEGYAAVVLLSALALLLFALLTFAERRILPWAYHQSR